MINPSTTDTSTLEKKVEITITAIDDDEAEAANEDERGAIKAPVKSRIDEQALFDQGGNDFVVGNITL